MPHAEQLILAGRDVEHDPATELFLQDHLRGCARCRELQRKVDRADRLLAARDDVAQVPRRRDVRIAAWSDRAVIVSLVVVLVVGVVAGTAIRTFRAGESTSEVAAPGGPPAPALPKDWQLVTVHDLLIPLPPGWQKTIDTTGNSDRLDPAPPQILYFEDRSTGGAAVGYVSIWIWPSRSLDELVRKHFVEGNLSYVSQGTIASWRPTREVIGVSQWSDARGSGSNLGRNLFVQVDPERVVMVTVNGPQVPSKQTEPTTEMLSIQNLVTRHIVALQDANRTFMPDQARAVIERTVPLNAVQATGSVPTAIPTPATWSIKARTDSLVRVISYSNAIARRNTEPDASRLTGDPARTSSARAVGNLVVWAVSPDANLRYAVLTALDALFEMSPSPSPDPSALTACPRTRAVDAVGVFTTNGVIGIVGDTYASASASEFKDQFVMVTRGAKLGDRASVQFTQIGSSAPATWVAYGVAAEPARTPWGEVAFNLGVKPIGFENSCWRLLVDGTDSGIVLFVGP